MLSFPYLEKSFENRPVWGAKTISSPLAFAEGRLNFNKLFLEKEGFLLQLIVFMKEE